MEVILLKSLLAGFFLAIPLGPLGAIALNKMIAKGALHGVYFGLGFAFVDLVYSLLVGIGGGAISTWMLPFQKALYLVVSIFFIVLAVRLFFTRPSFLNEEQPKKPVSLGSIGTALFLGLTSPATVVAFTGVFAGFNLFPYFQHFWTGALSVISLVTGGFLWWLFFSLIIHILSQKIAFSNFQHLNHFFGVLIILLVLIASIIILF